MKLLVTNVATNKPIGPVAPNRALCLRRPCTRAELLRLGHCKAPGQLCLGPFKGKGEACSLSFSQHCSPGGGSNSIPRGGLVLSFSRCLTYPYKLLFSLAFVASKQQGSILPLPGGSLWPSAVSGRFAAPSAGLPAAGSCRSLRLEHTSGFHLKSRSVTCSQIGVTSSSGEAPRCVCGGAVRL